MRKKKILEFLILETYGIEKADGEYIYFIDSDDYIEKDMFQDMIEIMRKEQIDLITTGFFSEVEELSKKTIADKIYTEEKLYTNKEEIKQDFIKMWNNHIYYNVWNKLYSKKIIDKYHIRFPKYNWGEDVKFNQDYLIHINTVYNTSKCYYHYVRERNGSTTRKYNPNLFEIRVKENKEFIDFFEKYEVDKEEYNKFLAKRYIERTLGCIENLFCKECEISFKEKYQKVREIINHEETKKYLKIFKPDSKKVFIMLIPYKLHLYLLAMLMGKTLANVKERIPRVFNRLKNRR